MLVCLVKNPSIKAAKKVMGATPGEIEHNFKQSSLYVLMNDKRKVLHNNGKMVMILKDTVLFQKLIEVVSDKPVKVLN